jgi:ATP-dependent helicase/nuclease subunit B
MSLRFLIGRSGSGKTTRIREEIIGKLKEQPQGKPLILLVPEQATFHTEHALLSSREIKGSVRAQVLGFRRLAYRVMQETGGAARTPVTEEGKKMLLYKIVRRRKDELQVFRDSGDQLGFVDRLNALFTEFKRYGENSASLPEQLERIQGEPGSPILNSKIQDILTLYRDFEQELAYMYLDGEDTMMRLAAQLPHSAWLEGADIWLDGYRGFTPQEYKVIEQLLLSSASLTVSLTLDRAYEPGRLPHELDLFHSTASVYVKMQGMARERSIDVRIEALQPEVLPRFASSPALAHLEAGFDRRRVWTSPEHPAGIELYAAADRRAELEGAIREMRRLARDEGVRYRDMAVFVRNPADYEHLLEPLFAKYEVPLFIDQKRDILHHPLVEFVRASLDIVRRRWRYEDVFRAVKTDLLLPPDGSVTRDCMDELENYVLACGIQGSRWTDGRPWQAVPNLSLEMEETERVKARDETLERMERCRAAVVVPLHAFEKRMSRAKTAREQCEAVYRLLEDADIGSKLDLMIGYAQERGEPERAREHSQIWDAVLELLDQIHEMVGEEKLPFELFAGMLETGLAEYRLALIPPALDQVLVGSPDRTRLGGIQYAFLLGVNEGIMPAVPQEDGVLSEEERSRLSEQGIALAPDVTRRLLDERFLAYTAMTSAGRKLWVSYPVADEEGRTLLPSEYIRHLRMMFKGLKEKPLLSQPLPGTDWTDQSEYALHAPEALSQLIVQLRQWLRGADIAEPWWEVYNWYADNSGENRVKLETLLTSLFYENRSQPLRSETSRVLYGKRLRTSVSRMERFVACPFSHFASHGLKLKGRQIYKLKAPDIGQLFHAALGSMAARLKENNRSWGSLSAEECRREAETTVDRLAPRLQGQILLSSKRYGYIFRKLKDIVGRASLILGEHARRGSFEPLGLELDFGPGKDLPPLTFELENGVVMEVIGRIDRVDVAEGEEGLLLRVIDYKSSHKDLKLHEVYYGLALQMLTYLDVLLEGAEQWLGEPAYPAGTLYFHVHNPLLQSANGMSAGQAEQELLKRFKMKGLLLADRDVIAKMDAELDKGHSAILPVAVKADGGFYSSAAVASPEQWQSLLSTVRSNIRNIGTRMTEGEVDIVPYRILQETACDFCSYRPVCQFDDSLEGSRYRHLAKPGKEQLWNMLNNNHEGGRTE